MKVLVIAEPYIAVPPIKYGGTERVIYYLIKGLQAQGHEVILLASADSEVDCKVIPICEKHIYFGKDREENKKVVRRVSRIHTKMKHIIREQIQNVDIIHSHGFDLIDFQDTPNITTLHGPFIFSQLKYFEKRKDLFFASISEDQQVGFPDLQYVGVCYNGLDPSEFPFVAKPDNYLCFVGRLDPEKNPHLAIELAIKLGMKIKVAAKLDWLGKDYYDSVLKPLFAHPLVEYLGEVAMKEKVDIISHAKVNLHPTGFREPFGLTVLEAAYCGTPTLAISKGSMPELIEEGRTGLLVDDFVEGYHHIERLYEMDRKYISQRSKLLFNHITMAKQYELVYEKVLKIYSERQKLKEVTGREVEESRAKLRHTWEMEQKKENHI